MIPNRTYLSLSREEIEAERKLTKNEQAAVDAFLAAAKALPKSLCVDVDDDEDEPGIRVYKRITGGSCTGVAFLKKKSLIF